MADTEPLLAVEDGSPAPEDQNFLPEVIFFHGKELRTGMGMRQSFIRKPGTEQVLVRIGIGRDGVFKVDGLENKVVEHWPFSELKDWSFSGYSFTLQFRSSANRNYSVRTDDGEAICSYIEDFQKHPEKALKRARENPPNSKIPESGVRTLRRKFSGADSSQTSPSDQVKFYTMNRRAKKPTDPTSKIAHNIEVDSRLRDAYTHKFSPEPEPAPIVAPLSHVKGKVNGIAPSEDEVISPSPSVPTTTRGESTANQTTGSDQTEPPPSTTTPTITPTITPATPPAAPPTATPATSSKQTTAVNHPPPKHQKSEPSLPSPAAMTATGGAVTLPPPPVRKDSATSLDDPNDYFLLRQRSVSETTVQRGNSRPINLVKPVVMPWSSGGERSGKAGPKSQTLGAAPRRGSTPVVTGNKGGAAGRNHSNSLLPSNGTSKGVSLEQELLLEPTSSASRHQTAERHSSEDAGGLWYESPPTPEDNKPRLNSPPYDTLSRSDSGMSSDRVEVGFGIQIHSLKRESTSNSMDDFQMALSSPPLSPLYDRLPPSSPLDNSEKAKTSLSAPVDLPMRRNVSQPVMSGRGEGGARGVARNSISPGPESIAEEDEEEDSDDETSIPPPDQTGVVRRPKKKTTVRNEPDPFEDLLGTPQAIARLRWSQELNPLYDLIQGMKITESISSQERGIKLYSVTDTDPAKKMKKMPSTIFEEQETSPKRKSETDTGGPVPIITHTPADQELEDEREMSPEGEGDRIPMIIPEHKTSGALPRAPRRQHNYEEVALAPRSKGDAMTTSIAGLIQPPPVVRKMKENSTASTSSGGSATLGAKIGGAGGGGGGKSSLAALTNPAVRRLQTLESPQERSGSVSPRLGKRELQRRSRTVSSIDDTEAIARKQKPLREADMMKDFSFVMREFRLFYVKMPNGQMHTEVCNINRPVAELREKLCDLLGIDNVDHYQLYSEGACLTSLKEAEPGEGSAQSGVSQSNSLTHIMDHMWLPDLGSEPLLLKPSLSFHMQGITTSRVLALMCDDVVVDAATTYPSQLPPGDEAEEFHKHWVSIVQGNVPCTTEQAVRLAAVQYQAYFLDRTAVHSVVGFCRPNEFLPTEFSGVRGVEQKMYKEQEKLKAMKTHKEVHAAYVDLMSRLPTYNTVFFPVREPRKKVLQSTKLKPIILGVGPLGIMRVDPKTKEVLAHWDFQVLRNWAYSRKTFVLAFTDKNYPVESNQAKWISTVVDFFVDSIISTGHHQATASKS